MTKVANVQRVTVGDQFTYTITATNRGPGTAENVVVTDTPSPRTLFVSATPSQGTCSQAAPVRCELGTLAPGASARVVVRVVAVEAGALPNGATAITSTTTTTPPADRVDVAAAVAASGPIVGLRKRASRHRVNPGDRVIFTMTAIARGRGTARDIRICDRLPRRFTVVRSGGASRQSGRVWCWRIAALSAGSQRSVRLVTVARGVSRPTVVRNPATLTHADQAPRFARAFVRVVPP